MKLNRLIFIGLFFLLLYYLLPGKSGKILIKPNSPSVIIAQQLKDAGIIRSKWAFLFLTRITGTSKKLKSGYYYFSGNWLLSIWWKIYQGRTISLKITIPEGLTAREIAQRLSQEKLEKFSPEEFLSRVAQYKLEGHLFPATYSFSPNITTAELLSELTSQFYLNFSLLKKTKKVRLSDAEILTLASIVEKETADFRERKIIADIFWRRLQKRIPLQSCATVIYALKQKEPNKKITHLSYKDTRIPSPYNTYRRVGLPPGPICSPGLSSIGAVLEPENNNYWYFFVSATGSHIFSRTYQQHQQNQKNNQK